jgi:hypothetical protein
LPSIFFVDPDVLGERGHDSLRRVREVRARRRLVAFGVLALLTVLAAACSSSPSPQSSHGQRPTTTTTLAPTTTAPSTTTPTTSTPVAVPAGATTAPPASIASDCSKDVSGALHKWFKSLAADTTVVMHPGACYLVDEGVKLKNPQGLTVSGGEFKMDAVPQDQRGKSNRNKGQPVFWLIGGSHVAFESMHIVGANQGGFHWHLAFEAAIRSDGVDGLSVSNVTVSGVYGDGVELNVLRGDHDNSGKIIRPTKDVTITHVTIGDAGRIGISMSGVSDVSVSDAHFSNIGLDDFDLEADQGNEGAKNVTVDGCTANGAKAALFASGGLGEGELTSNINVENCTMYKAQGGFAIYVKTPRKSNAPKGPITFTNDHFICGHSVYVACVDVTAGIVTISHSSLVVAPAFDKERMYTARRGSTIVFDDVTAKGYGKAGRADRTSTVHIIGGTWESAESSK